MAPLGPATGRQEHELTHHAAVFVGEQVARRPGGGVGVRPGRLARLTDRERDVVKLVAERLSNEEMGVRPFMSPLTAKTHLSRAVAELGVRDRVQLVSSPTRQASSSPR